MCGWSQRAKAHLSIVEGAEFDIVDTRHPMYNPHVQTPQVYKDGEYIGGFYELVKELPV